MQDPLTRVQDLIDLWLDKSRPCIPCLLFGVEGATYDQIVDKNNVVEGECIEELNRYVKKHYFAQGDLTPLSWSRSCIEGNYQPVDTFIYSTGDFRAKVMQAMEALGFYLGDLFVYPDCQSALIPTVQYSRLEEIEDGKWVNRKRMINALGKSFDSTHSIPTFKSYAYLNKSVIRWEFEILLPDSMWCIATALSKAMEIHGGTSIGGGDMAATKYFILSRRENESADKALGEEKDSGTAESPTDRPGKDRWHSKAGDAIATDDLKASEATLPLPDDPRVLKLPERIRAAYTSYFVKNLELKETGGKNISYKDAYDQLKKEGDFKLALESFSRYIRKAMNSFGLTSTLKKANVPTRSIVSNRDL